MAVVVSPASCGRAAEESLPELGCPGEQLRVDMAWFALVLREAVTLRLWCILCQRFNDAGAKCCFLWLV